MHALRAFYCHEQERPIVDNDSTIGLTFYQLCINQFLDFRELTTAHSFSYYLHFHNAIG